MVPVVQFSSSWYLCARKNPYALHPVSQKVPQRCLWDSSNVRLIESNPLSSFQGISSGVSSFHDSLLHSIDGVFLGFVPAGNVSSSWALKIFREASHLWWLLCPPVYLLCHSDMSRAVHSQEFSKVDADHCLGFPFHFLITVASLFNLWGWWHVWSDCHLLKQSSVGHRWLLPAPLSSWKLRPYRLHWLRGWWSHLTWQWSPTRTVPWWLSHQCTLLGLAIYCFLEWEAWSLPLFCLLAISTVLSHVFWQECIIETPKSP